MNIASPGLNPLRASFMAALESAENEFERLPMDHPKRGELARRIRAIEEAIDDLTE